jgi:hypothetical protein
MIDAAIDTHLALYEELVSGALTKAERRTFVDLMRKQTLAFEEGRVGGATQADTAAGDRPK